LVKRNNLIMITCRNKWFAKVTYERQPASTNRCPGCGKRWRSINNDAVLLKRFENMVGLEWPVESTSISLPLKRDFDPLGLDSTEIPERIPLCLGCTLDYMQQFNEELAEMKKDGFRNR